MVTPSVVIPNAVIPNGDSERGGSERGDQNAVIQSVVAPSAAIPSAVTNAATQYAATQSVSHEPDGQVVHSSPSVKVSREAQLAPPHVVHFSARCEVSRSLEGAVLLLVEHLAAQFQSRVDHYVRQFVRVDRGEDLVMKLQEYQFCPPVPLKISAAAD